MPSRPWSFRCAKPAHSSMECLTWTHFKHCKFRPLLKQSHLGSAARSNPMAPATKDQGDGEAPCDHLTYMEQEAVQAAVVMDVDKPLFRVKWGLLRILLDLVWVTQCRYADVTGPASDPECGDAFAIRDNDYANWCYNASWNLTSPSVRFPPGCPQLVLSFFSQSAGGVPPSNQCPLWHMASLGFYQPPTRGALSSKIPPDDLSFQNLLFSGCEKEFCKVMLSLSKMSLSFCCSSNGRPTQTQSVFLCLEILYKYLSFISCRVETLWTVRPISLNLEC